MIAVALAIQTPGVQTRIADKAVNALSEKLDGEITFEKIHFKPFTTLVLKNVVIIDKSPVQDPFDSTAAQIDTFFRAQYIIAKFTLKGLRSQNGLHLEKATITDAEMNLVLEDCMTDEKNKENNLSRIFRLKKKQQKNTSDKELFHIRKVEIDGFAFRMKNYSSDKTPFRGGINWNDLDISDISLKANELQFKGGVMSGGLEELSFREKSGYICHEISGSAKVGNGKTIVKDLKLNDPWSDINIPLFMMSYSDINAFKDYIAEVRMDAEFSKSVVDFQTIMHFSPQLEDNRLIIDVRSGKFGGTVDDFTVSDMLVSSRAGGFEGIINGRMTGIPEIEDTSIDAKIQDFTITSAGLSHFVTQWMREGSLDLGKFAPGTAFNINAHAKGLLNRLDVDADIRSAIGKVNGDIRLEDIIAEDRQIGISGKVSTEDLNIGKVVGKDIIGKTSMRASGTTRLAGKDAPTL